MGSRDKLKRVYQYALALGWVDVIFLPTGKPLWLWCPPLIAIVVMNYLVRTQPVSNLALRGKLRFGGVVADVKEAIACWTRRSQLTQQSGESVLA
jgi:hypothetical protein